MQRYEPVESIEGAADKLELAARLGYGARGIVYLLTGGLTLAAALGLGGRTTDTRDALREILRQPFGDYLLGAVALGLLGFAVWRFVQAIWDADRHGTDAKGLAVRAALLVSAIIYLSLTTFALSLIFNWGASSASGDGATRDWTAWLLARPFGRWLVAALGLAVSGVGVAHFWRAFTATFLRRLRLDARTRPWAVPVSRFGLASRGVVFLIIGGFLTLAAIQSDASEARGLSGALLAVQQQPYGWGLLALVALGLIAFGAYSFIETLYRRIGKPAP